MENYSGAFEARKQDVEALLSQEPPRSTAAAHLERYRAAGVTELVRFDASNDEQPIRVWDRVDGEASGARRGRS